MNSNPLNDIVPGPARKAVYALLALVAIGMSAWQVSGGDWFEFVTYVLSALGFATAASNITGPRE